MPRYETPAEFLTSISSIQWATQSVQGNRAKINRLMNGDPPWTEAERRSNRLNTNVNWLEAPRIVKNSAYQLTNAFFGPGDYFTVNLDTYSMVPVWKRDEWSSCLTTYINKALRDSNIFESTIEQAVAQTVLHGMGPSLWKKAHICVPETCGVDDVMVPAGTLADMSNLNFFAIYREWTWAQLRDMVHGVAVDKGWNVEYVDSLLASLYKQPLQPLYQGNRWMFPEKIAEDSKENSNTFAAAALGRALVWDCYFLDEESRKWNRRILLDYNNISPEGLKNEFDVERKRPEFLFEKDDFAEDWRHIIHWFIGNCSTVAPFRYYSIRSIGYQLYGPAFAQNMARNRTMDHVLQTLLTWFRNVSEDDRERLEEIQLQHLGIFPDGLSMVTANERYTADWNLVGNFLQGNRQLMAESSAAYLPDVAVEGEKPAMTATESLIRNNASVTLTSSVQNQLYRQAKGFFNEIYRRICIKDQRCPIVKEVLRRMKLDRIPEEILNADVAEITPNRVMGGGNRAVELTTARALFEAKPMFPTAAGPLIDRKYMLALTNDPEFVRGALPPVPQITSTQALAEAYVGTLMAGNPVQPPASINQVEYVQTMIGQTAQGMQSLEALQQQPAGIPIMAQKVAGLINMVGHTEQVLQTMGGNPQAKEFINGAQRTLVQMGQQLKAYSQRVQEMEQAQQPANGMDAKTAAQVQALTTIAQAKAQVITGTAELKNQHKDAAFMGEQQRKDVANQMEIRRKNALTQADVAATDLTTTADLVHQAHQARLDHAITAANAAQGAVHTEEEHQQGMVHAQREHQQTMAHTEQSHQQGVAQAQEKHETDLQAAKAKAAAAKKSKPSSKK